MPDTVLPLPQPQAFDQFLQAQASARWAKDAAPRTLQAWRERRESLRRDLQRAMGPLPDRACALEARVLGTLRRVGYRIDKLLFQSRPDVWVTANIYVPEPERDRRPAVLVVHGHWAGARRDPVVQARCLGLVQIGFVVLAVDAFGAGERYTTPRSGSYHGALYGSTLWPSGHTLLGMQVYDNRRAVDYLCSRPDVDRDRLGVTGASGGGNQSMYAGAMDDRLAAVAAVCSVGTYQSYLQAACCVCEVLPGALRFTEEGDVLGLVAPRALLVINATRDSFNFSVGQARISIERARAIYQLESAPAKVRHLPFESVHAYNQPMREAMYGWMTRWLKNEGKGEPIAEPRHVIETAEDLACFPGGMRPAGFVRLPAFAAQAAQALADRHSAARPNHVEEWESTALDRRGQLRRVLGDIPTVMRPAAKLGEPAGGDVRTTPVVFHPEPNLPIPCVLSAKAQRGDGPHPACVLLHLEGKQQALAHRFANTLVEANWTLLAPDLRATGETRPANDAIAGAPDHNSAEHAVWMGRPLLGQWLHDVRYALEWLAAQPGVGRLSVVGIGHAGVVALAAAALFDDRVHSAGAIGTWASFVTSEAYPNGTPMGILAPGILSVGDIPHLAALAAPRKLWITEARTAQAEPLAEHALRERFAFTRGIYGLFRREQALTLSTTFEPKVALAAL